MTAPTWPAGTRPTAEQLDEFLTLCSPTERRDTLDRLLSHDEAGLRCWESDHERQLEGAWATVRDLAAKLEEYRQRPPLVVTLADDEADELLADLERRLSLIGPSS